MLEVLSEKVRIDLSTGELLFAGSGLSITRGKKLTEVLRQFTGTKFRGSNSIDGVTGLLRQDGECDPGCEGYVDFGVKQINGRPFILTADIADHCVNFVAMKADTDICDNRLGPEWEGERKVREVHREWLSKHLRHCDKKSETVWEYDWGHIIDYADEITWGAAIWIVQNKEVR